MLATNFVLDDYLARIGFTGTPSVNPECLAQLMRCQLFSIPFENIDVRTHQAVSLVPEDLVNKLIYKNRGGYCYEVNGVFAMALDAIGFNYRICGARPMFYPSLRPKTHVVIIVEIGSERYLCDLGFGSFGIRAPIALSQLDGILQQDDDQFRLSLLDENTYLLEARVEQAWKRQFAFDLYPMAWIDMGLPNYFNSTHPDTIFVQKTLAIRFSAQGRSILVDNQLKRYRHGQVEITQVPSDEIVTLLQEEFHIDCPAGFVAPGTAD